MKRFLMATAVIICTLTAVSLVNSHREQAADALVQAESIEWPDLIPPAEPLTDLQKDPLADVPMNIRYDLGFIGKVKADADAGIISAEGPEYRNAMQLLERHRAAGIDVDSLIMAVTNRDREIQRRGERVNDTMDGKLVRLPGYALPLEMQDRGVTEFLLVPYVGACIHVPPPPPNQIVLAQLESAYQLENLYDPVWITGRLSAQSASTELFLVDGQAQVPMGYTMQVTHVEPID